MASQAQQALKAGSRVQHAAQHPGLQAVQPAPEVALQARPRAGTRPVAQQAAQQAAVQAAQLAPKVTLQARPRAGTRPVAQQAAQQAAVQAAQLAQKADTRAAQQADTRAAQQAAPLTAEQVAAQQEELLKQYQLKIHYSDRYSDDHFEYRHVILPKPLFKMLSKEFFRPDESGLLRLLSDCEWRDIGIQQSLGWKHYEVHAPEPHVLLFRRPRELEPLKPLARFVRK